MKDNKIITAARLNKILKSGRRKKIVFTNGCFDILHYGHVKYLQEAKSKGDLLIVGLNSDRSVRRLKGKNRPIMPQRERAKILTALSCVDYCIIFNDDTPLRLIKALQPDILVKGSDWKKEKIVGSDFTLARGGKVLTIPYVKNLSTTNVIKKIIRKY
jgi:D-beta-D-heptose 7-phosphate kinase/D-beta-D-heptose 1-phosphate adenosyltransferase